MSDKFGNVLNFSTFRKPGENEYVAALNRLADAMDKFSDAIKQMGPPLINLMKLSGEIEAQNKKSLESK